MFITPTISTSKHFLFQSLAVEYNPFIMSKLIAHYETGNLSIRLIFAKFIMNPNHRNGSIRPSRVRIDKLGTYAP